MFAILINHSCVNSSVVSSDTLALISMNPNGDIELTVFPSFSVLRVYFRCLNLSLISKQKRLYPPKSLVGSIISVRNSVFLGTGNQTSL